MVLIRKAANFFAKTNFGRRTPQEWVEFLTKRGMGGLPKHLNFEVISIQQGQLHARVYMLI